MTLITTGTETTGRPMKHSTSPAPADPMAISTRIEAIADLVKCDKEVFKTITHRMYEDDQVRTIIVLYHGVT